MTRALSTAIALTGLVTLASALIAGQSRAHDAPTGWTYPLLCCSNKDCKQISSADVRPVQTGWLIEQTGEVVTYGDKRLKDSPDGLYHRCAFSADFEKGRTLCLFVPPMGF